MLPAEPIYPHSVLIGCLLRALLVGIWHLHLLYFSQARLPSLASFPWQAVSPKWGFLPPFTLTILVLSISWSITFTWMVRSRVNRVKDNLTGQLH